METMKDMKNVKESWCERHRDGIRVFKQFLAALMLLALGFVATLLVFMLGGGYNG